MSVTHATDGHIEIDDGKGSHYSYTTQAVASTGGICSGGKSVCYADTGDGTNSVIVSYSSGKVEKASGESHNATELADDARQLGFTVVSQAKGIATVRHDADGSEYRLRYSPQLTQGAAGLAAGIRIENNGRIIQRYKDGWEQELFPLR